MEQLAVDAAMQRLKMLREKQKENEKDKSETETETGTGTGTVEIIPLNTDTVSNSSQSNILISTANKLNEDSLNKKNEDLNNVEFRVQSFFNIPTENHEKLFDFIYDYTFLCSFHPSVRTQWAEKMFDLLKYKGELCTLIFPIR